MMEWYLKALKNYAVFQGRARRKEYWMFFLVSTLIAIALGFVAGVVETLLGWSPLLSALVNFLYALFILVPSITVAVRRMHDQGRAGWWIIVPIVGFVFLFFNGEPNENEYGPDPKGA